MDRREELRKCELKGSFGRVVESIEEAVVDGLKDIVKKLKEEAGSD